VNSTPDKELLGKGANILPGQTVELPLCGTGQQVSGDYGTHYTPNYIRLTLIVKDQANNAKPIQYGYVSEVTRYESRLTVDRTSSGSFAPPSIQRWVEPIYKVKKMKTKLGLFLKLKEVGQQTTGTGDFEVEVNRDTIVAENPVSPMCRQSYRDCWVLTASYTYDTGKRYLWPKPQVPLVPNAGIYVEGKFGLYGGMAFQIDGNGNANAVPWDEFALKGNAIAGFSLLDASYAGDTVKVDIGGSGDCAFGVTYDPWARRLGAYFGDLTAELHAQIKFPMWKYQSQGTVRICEPWNFTL
jgi:hypothetical protein